MSEIRHNLVIKPTPEKFTKELQRKKVSNRGGKNNRGKNSLLKIIFL
jgi:hypothetical protein